MSLHRIADAFALCKQCDGVRQEDIDVQTVNINQLQCQTIKIVA